MAAYKRVFRRKYTWHKLFRRPPRRRPRGRIRPIVPVFILVVLGMIFIGSFMWNGNDVARTYGKEAVGYFTWPAPELHTVTSPFQAARKHPVLGVKRAHNGVDISGEHAMGSPVVAIGDGQVISIELEGGERGMNLQIQHCTGRNVWISRYQHLSAVKAQVGEKVQKGTAIGAVGDSGTGTGPHLHLELTYNGVLVDPLPLIE